jgi:hypothetical protein
LYCSIKYIKSCTYPIQQIFPADVFFLNIQKSLLSWNPLILIKLIGLEKKANGFTGIFSAGSVWCACANCTLLPAIPGCAGCRWLFADLRQQFPKKENGEIDPPDTPGIGDEFGLGWGRLLRSTHSSPAVLSSSGSGSGRGNKVKVGSAAAPLPPSPHSRADHVSEWIEENEEAKYRGFGLRRLNCLPTLTRRPRGSITAGHLPLLVAAANEQPRAIGTRRSPPPPALFSLLLLLPLLRCVEDRPQTTERTDFHQN